MVALSRPHPETHTHTHTHTHRKTNTHTHTQTHTETQGHTHTQPLEGRDGLNLNGCEAQGRIYCLPTDDLPSSMHRSYVLEEERERAKERERARW